MIGRLHRLFTTSAVYSIMSEGISKQLVLPKGRGFGLRDGALDKDAFRKVIPVLAAKVPPEKAGVLLKAPVLKRCVYSAVGVRSRGTFVNAYRICLLELSSMFLKSRVL